MKVSTMFRGAALLILIVALALLACGRKEEAETSAPALTQAPAAVATDPVCGFRVDPATAYSAEYEGETYYFCDPGCKAYFLEHAAEVLAQKPTDPVCGMEVDPATATSYEWGGREFFFCADRCRDQFAQNPEQYAPGWDPVCHMTAPMEKLAVRAEYDGMPMTFCSEKCRDAFMAEPGRYLFAECPTCGQVFPQADAGAELEHEGRAVYFCCAGCKARFEENPGEFFGHPHRGHSDMGM